MSDNYSSEFKAKVALDAVAQGRAVIEKVAQKHNVSEEEVIAWASQLQDEAAKVFSGTTFAGDIEEDVPEAENVTITTGNKVFQIAVDRGVTKDDLNYSKLIFWSGLGISLLIIFIVSLVYFTQYSLFEAQREVSSQTHYSDVKALYQSQKQELNSFGVVDLENGIYRVPIDSAISRMAID
ncbi:MAG: transposase [Balneolaceae bacterium]